MAEVSDPALFAFEGREQPESLERFMESYRARATREKEELKPYEEKHGYRF